MESFEGFYEFVGRWLGVSTEKAKMAMYARGYSASEHALDMIIGDAAATFYPTAMVLDGLLLRWERGERV